jgi:transposase
MERWSVEHRAFAVETYFKNDSVVLTQQIFGQHFNVPRNNSVPSRNTVLLWVRNCRETASAAKSKPPGREPSLKTPENIQQMRQASVRYPRWSASRNAIALRISDRTVRRILREGLNFHSYKMVMVQAINDQDTVIRKTVRFCWTLWITTTLTKFSWQMKQIFIFVAMSILKTVATGQQRTLAIFTRNLYILRRLVFGVV